MISAESGTNDGLGLPFVMLPLLMLTKGTTGEALTEWALRTLLWEVVVAVVLGWTAGMLAGNLLEWVERHEPVRKTSLLSYTLALSLTVLGIGRLIGVDGILAVFIAGRGFVAAATTDERRQEEHVQEAVNQFFILPIFALMGLMLPWDRWMALGWHGVALAAAVLLLRRLPAVLGLSRFIPALKRKKDATFAGWFGPIGVAALFYITHATEQTHLDTIWVAGSLIIASSILVHGMSAAPGIRLYSRAR